MVRKEVEPQNRWLNRRKFVKYLPVIPTALLLAACGDPTQIIFPTPTPTPTSTKNGDPTQTVPPAPTFTPNANSDLSLLLYNQRVPFGQNLEVTGPVPGKVAHVYDAQSRKNGFVIEPPQGGTEEFLSINTTIASKVEGSPIRLGVEIYATKLGSAVMYLCRPAQFDPKNPAYFFPEVLRSDFGKQLMSWNSSIDVNKVVLAKNSNP